jgi:hypothetical protein
MSSEDRRALRGRRAAPPVRLSRVLIAEQLESSRAWIFHRNVFTANAKAATATQALHLPLVICARALARSA